MKLIARMQSEPEVVKKTARSMTISGPPPRGERVRLPTRSVTWEHLMFLKVM